FFTAKVDGKLVKIRFNEILFIEGLKEYVRIVCTDARHVTLESLKNLEQLLPENDFIRVHKSYIVAKDKVQQLNGNMLEIGKHKIPISRSKREEVVEWIFFK
ncbi:MAG: LytTR family transcriptional regulator, partial [Bacteroidetes bacterium]